jgi:hypothetical protein
VVGHNDCPAREKTVVVTFRLARRAQLPDRKSFTFMRSYPNNIPLSAKAVRAIGAALMPLKFDRAYSHHFERVIPSGAKQILQDSVERYIAAIGGVYDRA